MDIHNSRYRLDCDIENLKSCKEISEANKRTILGYVDDCFIRRLSVPRVEKLIRYVSWYGKQLDKPFKKATKEDIKKIVMKVESNEKWSENTKCDYEKILKCFYKWLYDMEDSYPPEVKWIKPKIKNGNSILPDNLLTEAEVYKLAEATDNLRDRAFILVLYESGCRIGELIGLQLKSVTFDEYGAVFLVSGKTGDRRVRIISSTQPLRAWINIHPLKDDQGAFLWVWRFPDKEGKYRLIDYAGLRKMLRKCAKRTDIKKGVNPHAFRHARATHLAKYLPEHPLKQLFGWSRNSRMASTYVHLSGKDVDDELLKIYGIKQDKPKELVNCLRCREINDPTAQFCKRCGLPLSMKDSFTLFEKKQQKEEITSRVLEKLFEKLKSQLDIDELVKETIVELKMEKEFEGI